MHHRDVDNSQKLVKLPGCEGDFSGCKALVLSPKIKMDSTQGSSNRCKN